jgi:SAM-dependent methyltransferase
LSSQLLWSGPFGNKYLERNPQVEPARESFWSEIYELCSDANRYLEVGSGPGVNLRVLKALGAETWGCDVNQKAVDMSGKHASAVKASGYDLPFRDGWFDMVFTAGVLIHQQPRSVGSFCHELARCSKTYVMAMEYWAKDFEEIDYRGQPESLWKGPYDTIYEKMGLQKIKSGFLPKAAGWDDVTWWVFLKK